MVFAHDRVPDGRSAGETGHILHGFVVGVADPDAHGELGREAHGPVVLEAVGRARLGRDFAVRQREIRVGAERGRARHIVAHDVRHDVGDFAAEDALGFRRGILLEHVAVAVPNQQRRDRVQVAETAALLVGQHGFADLDALVGEDCVCVGVVEQGHFTAAQHQAEAVEVEPAIQAVDAHAVGRAQRVGHADPVHHLDRGNVVRARQRIAQRDGTVILPVVVLRPVVGAVGLRERGRHVQNHGRGCHVLLQRGEIDVRLEA